MLKIELVILNEHQKYRINKSIHEFFRDKSISTYNQGWSTTK